MENVKKIQQEPCVTVSRVVMLDDTVSVCAVYLYLLQGGHKPGKPRILRDFSEH